MRFIKKELPCIPELIGCELNRLHSSGAALDYVELSEHEWARLYNQTEVFLDSPLGGQFGTLEGFKAASEARIWVSCEAGQRYVKVRRV